MYIVRKVHLPSCINQSFSSESILYKNVPLLDSCFSSKRVDWVPNPWEKYLEKYLFTDEILTGIEISRFRNAKGCRLVCKFVGKGMHWRHEHV